VRGEALRGGQRGGGRPRGGSVIEAPDHIGTAAALATLGAGCASWRKTAWQAGLGSFATDLDVVSVSARGDYLDATLVGHGLSLTVFTPNSEACASVLAPEASVDYVERGIAGRLKRDGALCDAIGYGAPLVQRARRPRGQDYARRRCRAPRRRSRPCTRTTR
jgi:hypothetical protein